MRFIISDESVNRYGYRILSRGMSTASFEKNPVVFYNHGTYSLPIGKAVARFEPTEPAAHKVAILAFGSMVYPAIEAGKALGMPVFDMRWVKPIDADLIKGLASQHYDFVTVEEGCIMGGAGSAVSECISAAGFSRAVLHLGLPDEFIDHGDPGLLLHNLGLDAEGIQQSIQKFFGEQLSGQSNVIRSLLAGRAANQ